MVSAWASANRCILGSKAVGEKSNEITVIPEVLKMLSLEPLLQLMQWAAKKASQTRLLSKKEIL